MIYFHPLSYLVLTLKALHNLSPYIVGPGLIQNKSILVPNCASLEFPLFNVYNHSLGAPFLSCAAIAHYNYTQPLTVDIQSEVLSSFICQQKHLTAFHFPLNLCWWRLSRWHINYSPDSLNQVDFPFSLTLFSPSLFQHQDFRDMAMCMLSLNIREPKQPPHIYGFLQMFRTKDQVYGHNAYG